MDPADLEKIRIAGVECLVEEINSILEAIKVGSFDKARIEEIKRRVNMYAFAAKGKSS